MSGSGWDWDAIAASDYPVVVNPAALRRDMVYCEFWTLSLPSESYGYVTGLVIEWSEWLRVREQRAGPLRIDLSGYGLEGAELYPFMRARFSLWTAPENPRWPRTVVAVWTLDGGFKKPGRA